MLRRIMEIREDAEGGALPALGPARRPSPTRWPLAFR